MKNAPLAEPIESVLGIGPSYGEQLRRIDVTTVGQLADSDALDLERRLAHGIPLKLVEKWVVTAREFTHSDGRRGVGNGSERVDVDADAGSTNGSTAVILHCEASFQLLRAGHLVGGRRTQPEIAVTPIGTNATEEIQFTSQLTAYRLGGKDWLRLGRTSALAITGEPVKVSFPKLHMPAGIYRLEVELHVDRETSVEYGAESATAGVQGTTRTQPG